MAMKFTVLWLFVATGLLSGAAVPAAPDVAAARRAAREEATRALGRPVAGVQIAVAHDGNLAFVDSFGLADAAEHRLLSNDTVFDVRSAALSSQRRRPQPEWSSHAAGFQPPAESGGRRC